MEARSRRRRKQTTTKMNLQNLLTAFSWKTPKAIGEFGDLHRELDEAYEKNDAAAVAALFT
jgi:hypothetical protein